MQGLFTVVFLLLTIAGISQQSRVLVLGEGIADAPTALLNKFEKDIAANPAAVIITGDLATRRNRLDDNPLLGSKINDILSTYSGPIYILPGELEYGPFQGNSVEQLSTLKESISEQPAQYMLVPDNGCPGPLVIENESWVLIFINTARFLHQGEKISFSECGQEDPSEFFSSLEETLFKFRDRPAVVIGHHPLRSRGNHAGYFPWYQHLLPPIIGSVYAGFRKYIGGLQDRRDVGYRRLASSITEAFETHGGVYYISGHEGYFHYDVVSESPPLSQIIAGALSKTDYAKPVKNNASNDIQLSDYVYVSQEPGYVNLALDRIYASQNTDKVTVAYRMENKDEVAVTYFQGINSFQSSNGPDTSYVHQTVNAMATQKLEKSGEKPGLMGNNYRAEWSAIISNIPVFDIGKEKGGLEIVKKGGGQQTRSLRLEAADGKQYVLRSVEKFPEKAVPIELRGTLAEDIISDQISASHPYGALAIPRLADAAKVYHANPRLVYLPDDPRLGQFREDFGDGLYLFEERADDDFWEDAAYFGNPPDIVSTADVIEKLHNDADHIIDEDQVIRSRLFDIWIGDWDRHEDQWRWGKYEDSLGLKHYRPIPRDRDQAFFWSDGRLMNLGSRKWAMPKFQGFNEEIRDVNGLAFNARYFDRTFLVGSDRDTWRRIAIDLQDRLSDQVIEGAIRALPQEIFALHGPAIIEKLKVRRRDLLQYAMTYYDFLSATVAITGSEEAEKFAIEYLSGDSLRLQIFRVKEKSGKKKYLSFERVFHAEETDELWVYGFEGDDRFEVEGNAKNAPLIRIIGGKGTDSIRVDGEVSRQRKNVLVYDKQETYFTGRVRDRRSDKKQVNQYNRYWFKYNKVMPLVTGGFNPDDGVFIGGGVLMQVQGFRKEPFASQHRLIASAAPVSASYNLSYAGEFTDVLGASDLLVSADLYEPSYGDFFYGFGNQSNFNEELREENRQFYRVRYSQRILQPQLRSTSRNGFHSLKFGPYYRAVKIKRDENVEDIDRFIIAYSEFVGRGAASEFPLLDTRRHYLGASMAYDLDLRDAPAFPRNGMFWHNEYTAAWQLGEEKFRHQRLESDLALYFTFGGALKTTLAGRVGGQLNWGEFEFYQAARLGGMSNLRGYRKMRFAGDQSFYYNLEVRVRVISFRSILFPAEAGFHVFRDQGRVWSDNIDEVVQNDEKAVWHRGLGAGLWIAPLGQLVISADYAWSNDEEKAFFLRFGFFF